MRYYNRMIAMHNKAKFAELQMCSKKCLGDSECRRQMLASSSTAHIAMLQQLCDLLLHVYALQDG